MLISKYSEPTAKRLSSERHKELTTFAVLVATMSPGCCEIMIEMVDSTSQLEWEYFERYLASAKEIIKNNPR